MATVKQTIIDHSPELNKKINIERINFEIDFKNMPRTETLKNKNLLEVDNLQDANFIISGGRGLEGKSGFKLLSDLAKESGAKIGATRMAVEAGWIDYSHQIGQTGITVNPDICIACGISGSIQHLVGMQSSKTIIAINKDPNAPIFNAADYGVVFDYKPVINELIKLFKGK